MGKFPFQTLRVKKSDSNSIKCKILCDGVTPEIRQNNKRGMIESENVSVDSVVRIVWVKEDFFYITIL